MSTTVARLEAVLSANTRDFDRAMDRSESRMHKVGKVAGVAGLAIAGGIVVGLEKSVKAAIAAQESEARLTQAFKNAHVAVGPLRKQIEGLEASGRKLGFTDEKTTEAMGSLITATRNMKLASKDLAVAQDVARFKHVDLTDATKMLTMAMTGSQRAAKQLGITVSPVTKTYDALKATMGTTIDAHEKMLLVQAKLRDKQLTGIAVVDAVRDHVKGQAKAYSDTAAGAMEQFHAQLQHIEVEIGNKLLPVMMEAIKWIETNWPAMSAVIKRTWETNIKPPLEAMIGLVRAVVDAIRNNWGTIGPIVRAVAAIIQTNIAIITGVIRTFTALLRGDWSGAWSHAREVVGAAIDGIKARIELALSVGSAILNAMSRLGSAMLRALGQAIVDGAGAVKNAITGLFGKVIDWAKHALGISSPSAVFHEIGRNSIQGFIDGVGSMGGALKTAVVHIAESAISKLNPFAGGHSYPPAHGGGTAAQNKRFAISQLSRFGWGTDQFAPLNSLWTQESGWSQYAKNKSSGAYGIPQALPPTKMPFAAQEAGGSSPVAQILWGLNYIKGRYGSPAAAWGFDVAHGMKGYDKGGVVPGSGAKLAVVHGGETIIPTHKMFDSAGTWQSRYLNFMERVWQFARPFFPNALGGMPPVKFTSGADSLFVGTDFTPNSRNQIPPPGSRQVYWPKWLPLVGAAAGSGAQDAARQTLIHEWTHEFQDIKATRGIRLGEGGATAFAHLIAPRIYKAMGVDYHDPGAGPIYGPFMRWVLKNKGLNWITKGQFGIFDKGGWLQPGLTLAMNNTGRPERVGGHGGDVVFNFPNYVGSKQELMGLLRDAAAQFQNRNGRPAFGS